MAENSRRIIEQIYTAFGEGDYENVLTDFDSDFVWHAAENSPLADRSPYRGRDAVRSGVFDRIAAGFQMLKVEPDEIFAADGDRIVVLGYYYGKFRDKSSDFRTQVAHIWSMRDGKAVKFQQYVDTLKISMDAEAD